jgi:hypothetical protein
MIDQLFFISGMGFFMFLWFSWCKEPQTYKEDLIYPIFGFIVWMVAWWFA